MPGAARRRARVTTDRASNPQRPKPQECWSSRAALPGPFSEPAVVGGPTRCVRLLELHRPIIWPMQSTWPLSAVAVGQSNVVVDFCAFDIKSRFWGEPFRPRRTRSGRLSRSHEVSQNGRCAIRTTGLVCPTATARTGSLDFVAALATLRSSIGQIGTAPGFRIRPDPSAPVRRDCCVRTGPGGRYGLVLFVRSAGAAPLR